mgnify:CR=1 FL=1
MIKVNIVGPSQGLPGEKGRGIISDPRIVRYVAGKVREIIGFGETADLKVIDATFTPEKDPSDKKNPQSFHYARLQRSEGKAVYETDVCYDYDADGILDGGSGAELVNLDAVAISERFLTVVDEPIRGRSEVWFCLLYTSDAADDLLCVDLGGRRINKKNNHSFHLTHWF